MKSAALDISTAVPAPGSNPRQHQSVTATLVELLEGSAAAELLEDPEFLIRWQELCEDCPWATAFQSPGFARTWYSVYSPRFAPVVVWGTDRRGRLTGLFTLAVESGTGRLVYAGTHHAEYQVWLARPGEDSFIEAALDRLRQRFPSGELRLLFLPGATPLGWLDSSPWRRRIELRPHEHPLMTVGPDSEVAASMRKKSNKSRINRLGRIGPLRLDQLHTRSELEAVLPAIMEHCDLRQGAVHGSTPFRNDPLKQALYLALMDVPGLMHATVLKLGDDIIASHVGVSDRARVSLGLITHSPFVAEHSPGKLHVLFLGTKLGKQGYSEFDLTPGGSYKERLATRHDQAYVLDIFFSSAGYTRHMLRQHAARAAKRMLRSTGREPARVIERLGELPGRIQTIRLLDVPGKMVRRVRRRWSELREYRVYCMPAESARSLPETGTLRRDHIPDLLAYEPGSWYGMTLPYFLSAALERLEDGQHVYTLAEEDRLLHCSWLIERQELSRPDIGHELALPRNSAVLWDDYTDARARGRGLHQASLCQRSRDAADIPGTEWLFIGVFANNHPSRHNIEKLGFLHHSSYFTETRLGKTRRWVERAFPQQRSPIQ